MIRHENEVVLFERFSQGQIVPTQENVALTALARALSPAHVAVLAEQAARQRATFPNPLHAGAIPTPIPSRSPR